ncbi:hypothetical protein NL676_004560 [Syzygium grande]|nr:hypothetical protein NL676_004560 [Syzygium grande]
MCSECPSTLDESPGSSLPLPPPRLLPPFHRRWSRVLDSPAFSDVRRLHGLLRPSVFALSSLDSALLSASLRLDPGSDSLWFVAFFLPGGRSGGGFPHARLAAIGPRIYIIGRNAVARYDTWTGTVASRSPMTFQRKKFAVAVHSGRIYVAGGGGRTSAVEEYDPDCDVWSVVSHAPRRRHLSGVWGEPPVARRWAEAHVYASSMDLYDVEARGWLRSRAVPGGGVAAGGGPRHHRATSTSWSDARRRSGCRSGASTRARRQVRLDSTVKFSCVGAGDKVVLVQAAGCIDDLLRRSGRSEKGLREGLVLVYDTAAGEWSRGADLPEVTARANARASA